MKQNEYEWLSAAEAASRLGLSQRSLYGLIDAGELTAYRFGRLIRLKRTDLDAYIEASRIEPGTLPELHDPNDGAA